MLATISRPGVHSAMANDIASLVRALEQGCLLPSGEEVMPEHLLAPDPAPTHLGIDRRAARTTDKQSRLLLAAALESLHGHAADTLTNCGLFVGIPTVDEPLPGSQAINDWLEGGRREPLFEHMKRTTAPLGWLAMLNSSGAAHVAARLGMHGPTAVYSPFGDAGLNALIDAALAVREGECDFALVAGVSPKHDPLLPVQYRHWSEAGRVVYAGEASASMLVRLGVARDGGLRLHGYARGYAPMPWSDPRFVERLLDQALDMAGVRRDQIGWVMPLTSWHSSQELAVAACFQDLPATAALLPIESVFGCLGPAGPLVAIGLAHTAMEHGRVWHLRAGVVEPMAQPAPYTLILAAAPGGQCSVVIVGAES